ncbi:hypothetical protein [Brachybacterium huguangmaarense]
MSTTAMLCALRPAVPVPVPVPRGIPAGAPLIVHGGGRPLLDALDALSATRGGRFEPAPGPRRPGRLRYIASGDEPRVRAGSRRGVPPRAARPTAAGQGPASAGAAHRSTGTAPLVHLAPAALDARADAAGRLRFDRDVLPLVDAELREALRSAPSAVVRGADLRRLDEPLAWLACGTSAFPRGLVPERNARCLTREAIVRHIEDDLRGCAGDPAAARVLGDAVRRIDAALRALVPVGRLVDTDAATRLRWWRSLVAFAVDGVPAQRLERLLALERAGIVVMLGPRLSVGTDPATGMFVAEGAGGARAEAERVLDLTGAAPVLRRAQGSSAQAA